MENVDENAENVEQNVENVERNAEKADEPMEKADEPVEKTGQPVEKENVAHVEPKQYEESEEFDGDEVYESGEEEKEGQENDDAENEDQENEENEENDENEDQENEEHSEAEDSSSVASSKRRPANDTRAPPRKRVYIPTVVPCKIMMRCAPVSFLPPYRNDEMLRRRGQALRERLAARPVSPEEEEEVDLVDQIPQPRMLPERTAASRIMQHPLANLMLPLQFAVREAGPNVPAVDSCCIDSQGTTPSRKQGNGTTTDGTNTTIDDLERVEMERAIEEEAARATTRAAAISAAKSAERAAARATAADRAEARAAASVSEAALAPATVLEKTVLVKTVPGEAVKTIPTATRKRSRTGAPSISETQSTTASTAVNKADVPSSANPRPLNPNCSDSQKIRVRRNPKKAGSAAHARYEKYQVATTKREYFALGGKGDWTYDLSKGYIEFVD